MPHAQRQQQQRACQLVTEQNGQQNGPQHSQEKTECQSADVHAAQAVTGQSSLLVLAISRLHLQGVIDQGGWEFLRQLQQTSVLFKGETCLWQQNQNFDASFVCTWRAVVKPLDPLHASFLSRLFDLLSGRAIRTDLESGLPSTGHHAATGRPQHGICDTELLSHFFKGNACTHIGHVAQLRSGHTCLLGQVGAQRIQGGPSQIEASHQGSFDLDIEPAFDGA